MIHGQGHKGITDTTSHALLGRLMRDADELKEFFLPHDGPGFCVEFRKNYLSWDKNTDK